MNKVPISGEEGRGKGPFFPWGSEKIASQRLPLRPSLAAAPAAITVLLVKAPSVPHSLLLPPGYEVCYKRKGEGGGGEGAKRSQFYCVRGGLWGKTINWRIMQMSLFPSHPFSFFYASAEKKKRARDANKKEKQNARHSLPHV